MDSEEYKDRFSSIASHGFVSLGVAMGHQLGLFKALRNFKESVTTQKLADQCKLKERYVREWLGGMVAAQLVSLSDDDKFYIPEACKPHTEISFVPSLLPMIFENYKQCIQCFHEGGPKGFNYSNKIDLMLWMSEEGQLRPQKYIDEELFPLGFKKKDDISNVLDFGCGSGGIGFRIAELLPKAKIYGIDIDKAAIEEAQKTQKAKNIQNIEFILVKGGETTLGNELLDKKFDWVVMFDVLHDLPDPNPCINLVKNVLKEDGVFTAFDTPVHSDPRKNIGDYEAAMMYFISSMVCLPCSMSQEPAVGHGVGWGTENRATWIKAKGFKILNEETNSIIHCQKTK